ncbi:MAG: multiple sugar transport system ATP-binding protein [Frankiaceae bacterium]|nr:multiple sugar transport system ATP-binding protein [Frankiaceae bacterium]
MSSTDLGKSPTSSREASPSADLPAAGMGLEIRGVSRAYGATKAVDDISLSVAPGEVVSLLGPSGSGKSTLLRLVAGLDTPTGGSLTLDGKDALRLAPHERDVAMVFQHYALYPHLTAQDNLVLALRYGRGLSKSAAAERARETLELLGVCHLAKRKPAAMSGGQRQRIAIGRALATRSRLVLLDEPMSGLDAVLRASLRVEVVALLRRLGSTALFVTHDQSEAMVVGDRVAVLSDGKLEQVGTPDEVYDAPASRFVASFVGSPPMNVLEGSERRGPGDASARGATRTHERGGPSMLVGADFEVAAPENAVAVGVRPEDLRVGDDDGAGLRVKGEMIVSERLGADRIAYVQAASGLLAVRVTGKPPAAGENVSLTAPPEALSYFDGAGRLIRSA